MTDSTRNKTPRKPRSWKPKKPSLDFPLSSSTAGYWQRKINGKIYYFGRWGKVIKGKLTPFEDDGWRQALVVHDAQYDDLKAGREPIQFTAEEVEEFLAFSADKSNSEYRGFYEFCKSLDRDPNILGYLDFEGKPASNEELTVADMCNHFLTAKKHLLTTGEIVPRTFAEYQSATDRVIKIFGRRRKVKSLVASDFLQLRQDIASTRGAVSLGNEITRTKGILKFAYDEGLIDALPRFGQSFKKPSMKVLRKNKAENGKKLFSAEEILLLLDNADEQMRAMILLGINAAYGNEDCGRLKNSHINYGNGIIDFPRPKTGIERRCALWPETAEALRVAIENRPNPKNPEDDDLVFLTVFGNPWRTDKTSSPVGKRFGKLVKRLDLKQPGRAFYSLRHTHRTISDQTKDFPVCNLIMGHADHSMASVYREEISDERLQVVVDHIRNWLFGTDKEVSDV